MILGICSISFGQKAASDDHYKKVDKAIEDYTKAIAFNPKDSERYLLRGKAYFNREKNDKASGDFNKADELAPDSANVYLQRGDFFPCKVKTIRRLPIT